MKRETKKEKVLKKLWPMKVGESFVIAEFVKQVWGDYNYFIHRSFDVYMSHCRKDLASKEFRTIKGCVTRIS